MRSCASEGLTAALPLEVTLTDGSGADCPVAVTEADGGRLRCTYNPRDAGFHRLELVCRGAQLPGSPFSVPVASAATTATIATKPSVASSAGEREEPTASEPLTTASALPSDQPIQDRCGSCTPPQSMQPSTGSVSRR